MPPAPRSTNHLLQSLPSAEFEDRKTRRSSDLPANQDAQLTERRVAVPPFSRRAYAPSPSFDQSSAAVPALGRIRRSEDTTLFRSPSKPGRTADREKGCGPAFQSESLCPQPLVRPIICCSPCPRQNSKIGRHDALPISQQTRTHS